MPDDVLAEALAHAARSLNRVSSLEETLTEIVRTAELSVPGADHVPVCPSPTPTAGSTRWPRPVTGSGSSTRCSTAWARARASSPPRWTPSCTSPTWARAALAGVHGRGAPHAACGRRSACGCYADRNGPVLAQHLLRAGGRPRRRQRTGRRPVRRPGRPRDGQGARDRPAAGGDAQPPADRRGRGPADAPLRDPRRSVPSPSWSGPPRTATSSCATSPPRWSGSSSSASTRSPDVQGGRPVPTGVASPSPGRG